MATPLLGPESTNEYLNNFIKPLIDHFLLLDGTHVLSAISGEARDSAESQCFMGDTGDTS